ncbi:MAG: 4,5-DOPA dioxygenase extradiol [Gammaproteobacteria bacterium]|jgi:4,5-DOPA dioxygenase extradiol
MTDSNQATVLFIPHGGGPLPLLDEVSYLNMNRFLREFPATINKPEAIVVISAHWEEPVISITASQNPPMLYDYSGFPPQSYELQYPAPGHPKLASRIADLLSSQGIETRLDDERGLDHGVFIPLLMMYPDADIPCIQISLSNTLDAALHVQLGQALASLKSDNLLILGSGYSFHNMRALTSKKTGQPDEKNELFEQWLAQTCSDPDLSNAERTQRLVNWEQAPHARYCHPREEHLLPLQVCYGLGDGIAKPVFQDVVDGFLVSAYQW